MSGDDSSATQRPGGAPPVDLTRVREALADLGAPDVFRQLLAAFLRDAPARLATLRAAVAAGDTTAVQFGAHTLRGTSSYLGAAGLVRICGQFEESAAVEGGLARDSELLAELDAEFSRVRVALENELRQLSP